MDTVSIVQQVRRYKLATLPVILVTLIALVYVAAIRPKTYQAQASYILINPPVPPTPQQIASNPALGRLNTDNPLVRFNDLTIVVGLIAQSMSTPAMQQSLASQGATPGWAVSPSTSMLAAPVFQVDATGSTPSAATTTATIVARAAIQLLNKLQAADKVSRQYWISTLEIQSPAQVTLKVSSFLRMVVAVLGAGLIMLFIAVSTASGLAERRAMRWLADASPDPMEPDALLSAGEVPEEDRVELGPEDLSPDDEAREIDHVW